MTEKEFDKTINDIHDIYDFCTAHPHYDYITDDIYSNEHMVDFIKDLIKDINFESVQALLDFTDEIPFSDWYYVQDGIIYALYFSDLKSDLLADLRNDGFFTDEEFIEDEEDNNNNTDTDEDIIANDISILYL